MCALATLCVAASACAFVPAPTPTDTPVPPTEVPTPTVEPSPTVAPTPTVVPGGDVNVSALFETTDPSGKATGGTSPVKISVRPKSDAGVSVSFSESEVGGQGPEVRAAGWTAAVQSALLLGLDPSKLSYTYALQGHVDGPSAGAFMTVGTLAAILGDQVPNDFAMTGTINPDGSIGPVGGIPQKIDGAAKAGIKTILVPAGQASDIDLNTQQPVDLVKRGADQGVSVKLISNIYDAYQQATGKALPQPQSGGKPSYPPAVTDKMKAQAATWLAQYSDLKSRFNSLSPGVQKNFTDQMNTADQYSQSANKSLQEGNGPVALERAVLAVQVSEENERAAELVQTAVDRGAAAALQQIKASSSSNDKLSALYDRLRAEQASTASDAITLIDAYSNYAIAQSANMLAQAELQDLVANGSGKSDNDVLTEILQTIAEFADADVEAQVTTTELDLYIGQGSGPAPSVQVLNGLGELLRQAGQANMAVFNSVVVGDAAQKLNLRDEAVQAQLAQKDSTYQLALETSQTDATQTQSDSSATQLQLAYLTLGRALDTYALSTELVTKYYSLDATLDNNFNVTDYKRETALQNMLDLGSKNADNAIGVSTAVALPALYYDDNAAFYRDGTPQEKLNALFYYWQANILGRALANLTGEWGQKIQSSVQPGQNGGLLRLSGYQAQ